jgi:Protein of unknown function (DUF3592)
MTPMTWSGRPGRWLTITASFELVLAAVFFVIGFFNPILRFGFFLTAGILGIVAVGLLVWGRKWQKGYAEAQRVRAQGVPGQATILGMRQTGVYVNEQPQIELQLQVQDQMYGSRQVTMKEYVPLMMLGALSSGRPLPVKVDPANPNNVVIEWESALSGGMPMGMPMQGAGAAQPLPTTMPATADSTQYDPQARQAEKGRLLATGVTGTATVTSVRATGNVDSEGRPVYDLMLTIQIPGRQPTQGPARTGVPPDRVDELEVGDTVTIKADANNPAVMTIDWDG